MWTPGSTLQPTVRFCGPAEAHTSRQLPGRRGLEPSLLGGSWVVISGVISPLIWVITIVTLPKTLLITTHEPPSLSVSSIQRLYRADPGLGAGSFRVSGFRV